MAGNFVFVVVDDEDHDNNRCVGGRGVTGGDPSGE